MTDLKNEIRILFIEDVVLDAELVNKALTGDGLKFQMQRVDTRDDFLLVMEVNPPDVILSDHGLPSFSGFSALAIARDNYPEIPFIFVTDALTPEMEIEKLAPGVTDLVPKHSLQKLGPAIRRALENPKSRRKLTKEERDEVIEKLFELLAAYEMHGVYIPICAGCKKIRDKSGDWKEPEVYFRNYLELKFTHTICPKCFPRFSRPSLRNLP
jgi:DNA-binding NtrC family response regulator